MSIHRPIRIAIGLAAFACAVLMIRHHESGGIKGSAVPLEYVAMCIAGASVAAFVACRRWHWLPAPFIGGIVGAFLAGPLNSPYGGVLGLAVGTIVVACAVRIRAVSSQVNSTRPG